MIIYSIILLIQHTEFSSQQLFSALSPVRYLLFERDIYFGRENETKSSNSLQRLLASLALTDLLTGLVVQPLHGAMTIFLLQRISFLEFCGINLGFSISFVVIWHAVLGHEVISGERYLSIKYAFAHNEMLTKMRVSFIGLAPGS